MKTFFKTIVSTLLVVLLLIYCESVAMVVAIGTTLFFIWSGNDDKKEKEAKDGNR